MPKYVARLAQAENHPGTAVLRDVVTGNTFYQFSMADAYDMMGKRKEVFYVISIRSGAYHIENEVEPERVDDLVKIFYQPKT